MDYLVVDLSGNELRFTGKPQKFNNIWISNYCYFTHYKLEKGTIEKILGYSLSFDSDPVPVIYKNGKWIPVNIL